MLLFSNFETILLTSKRVAAKQLDLLKPNRVLKCPCPTPATVNFKWFFLAIVPSCFLLPYFDPKHQKRGAHRFETEHMKYIDIQI